MFDLFLKGGPVMYPLLICSIISLTVIIERAIFWAVVGMRKNQALLDDVLGMCQKGDWEGVRKRAAGSKNYVIRVLISGILHREYSLSKAMESAAADEMSRMGRFMGVLDTMITVAPLMGIFGTVLGIIESFSMLDMHGIENPQAVTGGISQALITTAAGLAIAIITVFPYNYYNSLMEKAAKTIEKYATSFEIVYEKMITSNNRKGSGDEG